MSLHKDSVKNTARLRGISLGDEIASALAPDVEYRLHEIIQHMKRLTLTTDDVNQALRLRNLEPIYEIQSKDAYYPSDEKELDFAEIINSPLPKCPRETTIGVHWLAVEGVQPFIPQNPPPDQAEHFLNPQSKTSKSTKVRPLVKQVLSKEMQDFYEKFAEMMQGSNEGSAELMIHQIGTDPSLSQLLPYFVQFLNDEIPQYLDNAAMLYRFMRLLHTMLESPHLQTEHYLHQLMPPILTCILVKAIGADDDDLQWRLRDYSASLLHLICLRYGGAYKSLKPRVTKTLLKAFLDTSKPLPVQYGAIVGISALGGDVVGEALLPNLSAYMNVLETLLKDSEKASQAQRCFTALLKAGGVYIHFHRILFEETNPTSVGGSEEQWKNQLHYFPQLWEIFGDALLPFVAPEVSNPLQVPNL